MEKLRIYGNAPFTVAVIHGGPGALGEMAPVAKELSYVWGTLEPLHTAKTVEGQIRELRTILNKHGNIPITFIGHSWGAWLSFIFAAYYPTFVRKLILIGSGPFEEKYASKIMETRLSRLNEEERLQVNALRNALVDPSTKEKNNILAQFAKLIFKADSFDPLFSIDNKIEVQFDVLQSVWKEASELRKSGILMELGKQIQCPVVAIHGDYDPHPYEGIERPLSAMIEDFRLILLKNCGHYPWMERNSRKKFYKILNNELIYN
ncbi:alpha/beta fold hydrolase [Polycladomyces subterraneus]|uniref:Alpha/beta hydrolase n=1 Tax=Polycladomyces subterraneus TaxID=1016997 RepID=A0ABT8IK89_9BACL|nr:alpha/beta hydrolase [Polycladomyces subterraneus]MDN4593210.1 alpha/beta hydrolase [Polycladomyces subterraneus]